MKVLIVEDETAAAVNLQAILRKVAPAYEVLAVLESIEDTVEFFRDAAHPEPDLVFMDIHLADGESFRIFDSVQIEAPIIFTTAYDEYALQAFKVNSIDYLLKPIKAEDLQHAIDKFARLTRSERTDYKGRVSDMIEKTKQESQHVFLVHYKDKIIPLYIDSVAFFYTSNEKVSAFTHTGERYIVDRTLEMRPHARNAAIAAARGGFLPRQPPVHRLAQGRKGYHRMVRQPSVAQPVGRDARENHHLEDACTGVQAMAHGGSPRGLVVSPLHLGRFAGVAALFVRCRYYLCNVNRGLQGQGPDKRHGSGAGQKARVKGRTNDTDQGTD